MSIFCSFSIHGPDPEDHPQPYVYAGSHILPAPTDPRGGSIDLGYVPGFIEREGRDDGPDDDEGVWPWLRVSLRAEPGQRMRELGYPEDTLILHRDQVERLRDDLSMWLLRCDDLEAWFAAVEAERPIGAPE